MTSPRPLSLSKGVRQRLLDPALSSRLGFHDRDRAELTVAVEAVLAQDHDLELIFTLAGRLVDRIGEFGPTGAASVWADLPDRPVHQGGLGAGVLAMLALLVSAPEVADFHASRGIAPVISGATLADLGQQVAVHRSTYGEFGLHTHGWLELIWSGALYGLGRLQFNLQPDGGRWVLSTHIPRTGPLTPESVDASFAAARGFFARHFPDYPAQEVHCQSWLLDPALSALLPDSNLAAFQRRWLPYGDPLPGDADVLFFVFNRRGSVDVASLPDDTALRRVAVRRWAAGEHWSVWNGRLPR